MEKTINFQTVRIIKYTLLTSPLESNRRVNFLLFLILSLSMFSFQVFAQSGGVAINSSGGAADNSAMLDVSSSNQGMRIPRVALSSTTSAAPITNPANSLLVYDSVTTGDVTPGFYYWDGIASKWIRFSTGSGGGWSTSGNAGTDTATNFIGTTDDKSWVMKTNSTERMKISKNGSIGIGTSNPASSAILDVSSTTKGQLIPRMTTSDRNAILSPAVGLQIFNIDCNINEYYTGTCWLSMSKTLNDPKAITSNPSSTHFCPGETRTYSILAVTGATEYAWTVPAGSTITNGQGTTSITVTFGNFSGNVCVKAINVCESSAQTCLAIGIDPVPSAAGNVIGPVTVYPNSSAAYAVASVVGATSYTWTLPTGASIYSGSGTNDIVVNFACNAVSGNISVSATGSCGMGSASLMSVSVASIVASAGPNVYGNVAIGGSPTASGGTYPYTYSWDPATNLSNSVVSNPIAQQCSGSTTTYTVIVTDAKSCTATSSVVVSRLGANAGANKTGVCGTSIGAANTAIDGKSPYTYLWSPSTYASGNILSSATVANPTATPVNTTTFTVTVTDANSCTTSSSMILTVGTTVVPFNYTGALATWAVPGGVTCVLIEAWGAPGGSKMASGGSGGYVYGLKTVSAGNVLNIYVGGAANVFNGGGSGSTSSSYVGAGGGGASDVRLGGTTITPTDYRILVAGGGGGGADGNGSYSYTPGGSGGYPSGGSIGAAGGTQTTGNALGVGGNASGCGGGGGGGYWGGVGGGGCSGSGGGGGSSYFGGMNANTGGYINGNSGSGQVKITY